MKHLFDAWEEIATSLKDRYLLICLDYDGTLTRIVRDPEQAKLSTSNRKTLEALTKSDQIQVAVISGRSLSDLKRHVGIKQLIYAGNHGLEFEGPEIHFIHPQAQMLRRLLKHLAQRLEDELRTYRGVAVENKELTLSVHFRKLNPNKVEGAFTAFKSVLDPYVRISQVATTSGKKVWEVRPAVRWNKGTTVLWLLGRLAGHIGKEAYCLYLGDDRTDEDAFRALRQKGLGIKVSQDQNASSEAAYCLCSIREVYAFLKRLIRIRDGSRATSNRLKGCGEPSL